MKLLKNTVVDTIGLQQLADEIVNDPLCVVLEGGRVGGYSTSRGSVPDRKSVNVFEPVVTPHV